MIEYANEHKFTHIRMVDDIISDSSSSLDNVKKTLIPT